MAKDSPGPQSLSEVIPTAVQTSLLIKTSGEKKCLGVHQGTCANPSAWPGNHSGKYTDKKSQWVLTRWATRDGEGFSLETVAVKGKRLRILRMNDEMVLWSAFKCVISELPGWPMAQTKNSSPHQNYFLIWCILSAPGPFLVLKALLLPYSSKGLSVHIARDISFPCFFSSTCPTLVSQLQMYVRFIKDAF